MISNHLLKAIDGCHCLTHLCGPASKKSPWVTLERDYALRSGKPVFSFDAATKTLRRDDAAPMDLPVFPSYTRQDKDRVDHLLRVMRDERSFDLFMDTEQIKPGVAFARVIEEGIMTRIERGGYIVLFWSNSAADSIWVEKELKEASKKYPGRVLIAMLEPIPLPLYLEKYVPVHLYNNDIDALDMNRLDDLIVRLYWLIDQNIQKAAA
jgi:hypothetical protein